LRGVAEVKTWSSSTLRRARDGCGARSAASSDALHRRRLPGAVERARLGPVEAQVHREPPALGGRQPVALALGARRAALQVQDQRAVALELEPIAIADRVAVDGIGGEEL